DVAGDTFLGMSFSCARCHDHKFDPIHQTDYFQLRAFFEPVIWRDDLVAATSAQQEQYREHLAEWEAATSEIRAQMDAIVKPYNDRKWKSTVDKFPLEIQACFYRDPAERTSWDEQMTYLISRQFEEEGGGPLKSMKKDDKEKYDALAKQLEEFADRKPAPLASVMTVTDHAGAVTPTLIPDDINAQSIAPGFPQVLCDSQESPTAELPNLPHSTGRRTALADWIGRGDNPLTMRVIVNRIWQQHFGVGIVGTANDFGHSGEAPTHPLLLDWLTADFVEHGWSLKRLHRQIVLSSTWRQSADNGHAAEYQSIDPAERLLWRHRVRRLSAEQIRDAMLCVSGEMKQQLGGPSVEENSPRRGLYVKSYRNRIDTFLHSFDIANGLKSVSQRDSTTTPTQSLLLINGNYALGRAGKMADRLLAMKSGSSTDIVQQAIRMTWGRDGRPEEVVQCQEFLGSVSGEDAGPPDKERLADLCHILLNSSEFLYVR
ncbi:MAG: DUF1553 domain-containing protein, partial [Planctomycetaceae bacterium]|nr:DUF1553 domain-containing protein [Planctomycetaceae bacterium]